jgi:hypothetical protein
MKEQTNHLNRNQGFGRREGVSLSLIASLRIQLNQYVKTYARTATHWVDYSCFKQICENSAQNQRNISGCQISKTDRREGSIKVWLRPTSGGKPNDS